jgi:putative peptide zinc metalloprotease protein
MNLTRALEVALPDIPARTLAERYPRLDPGTTFREHIEGSKTVVRVYVPSCGGMFTFDLGEWEMTRLFDGQRSYEEIAQIYSQQSGKLYDAEAVREYAESLEESEFWYKTPQEKNIKLLQLSREERRKKLKTKSKWADLSDVTFPAFNPDRFVTWVYGKTKFIYTPWFTILTLIGFGIGLGLTITHWREISQDTLAFYSFSNKSWGDVIALYTLGMFVVAVHEFAHAHACKHYGGRVPAMGFALVYLAPAFYTDTTEGFVTGSHYQRLIISLAGVWSELILCAIATPIWWGTPPETLVHDSAHFVMMMTGIMSLVLNWNPLMKLDGYYMLCDIAGIQDLKEDSTAYASAWAKRHIWRLPVEVPYIPKRRRLGFVIYALASGLYSYTVLFVVAKFAGNFVRNFSPEWGFIPEIGVALLVFRSRIRLLVNFMKFFYLDKKDRIIAWFTSKHLLASAVLLALFLAIPFWRESVVGKFQLEPASRAVVRAHIPGVVEKILVKEGQQVTSGTPLAVLRNSHLQADVEEARAKVVLASDQVNAASARYSGYGNALMEQEQRRAQLAQLSDMKAALELSAPISGTIVSPNVSDLLGTYLRKGDEVIEVADLAALRAKIYISEFDLSKVQTGAKARLQISGRVSIPDAQVVAIAARPTEMSARLKQEAEEKGTSPLHYYLVEIVVQNQKSTLKPGMTGVARVYGARRSIGGMAWEGIADFWGRKLW